MNVQDTINKLYQTERAIQQALADGSGTIKLEWELRGILNQIGELLPVVKRVKTPVKLDETNGGAIEVDYTQDVPVCEILV